MLGTFGILLLWVSLQLATSFLPLQASLCGLGFGALGGQWYRLWTCASIHGNWLHLALNAATLFWVGRYLERQLGTGRYLLFAALALPLSQIAYCAALPAITNVFGGSILIFSYIGLIAARHTTKAAVPRLRLGTWGGNWIAIYAIAGNFPMFPFMNGSTVMLHIVCFLTGLALGLAGWRLSKRSGA